MGPLEHIHDAALALIDEEGAEGLTVRAIATRAHYHRSTVMYHIGSMEQLEAGLRRAIALELTEGLVQVGDVDSAEADRTICARMVEYWHLNQHRLEFFAESRLDFALANPERPEVMNRLFGPVPVSVLPAAAVYAFAQFAALIGLFEHLADDDARLDALLDNLDVTRRRLSQTFRFSDCAG